MSLAVYGAYPSRKDLLVWVCCQVPSVVKADLHIG